MPITVWGWNEPGEVVSVSLAGTEANVTTNEGGEWEATLPEMQAGGPYTITIASKSKTVQIQDVLVGEVWIGSGQSNMCWQVAASANREHEIKAGNHPHLRIFTVATIPSDGPEDDVEGVWRVSSSENVGDFSAVGYYFGRELQQRLQVPIGIIHSSWGGSSIEAWTRESVMQSDPELQHVLAKYENVVTKLQHDLESFDAHFTLSQTNVADSDISDSSLAGTWDVMLEWAETSIQFPITLEPDLTLTYNHIQTPVQAPGKRNGANLSWSYEVDQLPVSINAIFVSQHAFRGKMNMALNALPIRAVKRTNNRVPALTEIAPQNRPARLFNGMIEPLTPFSIRGVIRYQGEANANAEDTSRYHQLFSSMIQGWRESWVVLSFHSISFNLRISASAWMIPK